VGKFSGFNGSGTPSYNVEIYSYVHLTQKYYFFGIISHGSPIKRKVRSRMVMAARVGVNPRQCFGLVTECGASKLINNNRFFV